MWVDEVLMRRSRLTHVPFAVLPLGQSVLEGLPKPIRNSLLLCADRVGIDLRHGKPC